MEQDKLNDELNKSRVRYIRNRIRYTINKKTYQKIQTVISEIEAEDKLHKKMAGILCPAISLALLSFILLLIVN